MKTNRTMRIAAWMTATAIAMMPATTSAQKTTTRIVIDGRAYEIEDGRPLVIRSDGTPGYADVDTPREIVDDAVAPVKRAVPTGAARAVVVATADDSAFRAPATEEGESIAIAMSSVDATGPQRPRVVPTASATTNAVPTGIPAIAPTATNDASAPTASPIPAVIPAVIAATVPVPAATAPIVRNWPANLPVPHALADGSFPTPNRSLTTAASVWHLRVALNVAALSCRSDETRLVAGYNGLLTKHRADLASAELRLAREYAANTRAGRARYDDSMTRLYNFWATPPAQAGFCKAAVETLEALEKHDAAGGALDGFCGSNLARLDAPFVDFYREYDQWRTRGAVTAPAARDVVLPTRGLVMASATTTMPVPTRTSAAFTPVSTAANR